MSSSPRKPENSPTLSLGNTISVENAADTSVNTQIMQKKINMSTNERTGIICGDEIPKHVEWGEAGNKIKRSLSDQSIESSSSSDSSDFPPAPDGGWGWVIVLSSFLTHLVADGTAFSFGILYVEMLQMFQQGSGKTAFVVSMYVSIPLLAGPIASPIVEQYGCRNAMIGGALVTSCGFILSTFAPNIEMLCVTLGLISGLGLAPIYIAAIVSVAFYFEKKRSLATGLATCGSGIGCFIFAPATKWLLEKYGFHGTLLLLGGIYLHLCVAGALMRPLEWKESEDSDKNFNINGSSSHSSVTAPELLATSQIRNRSVDALGLSQSSNIDGRKNLVDGRIDEMGGDDDIKPSMAGCDTPQTPQLDEHSFSMIEFPFFSNESQLHDLTQGSFSQSLNKELERPTSLTHDAAIEEKGMERNVSFNGRQSVRSLSQCNITVNPLTENCGLPSSSKVEVCSDDSTVSVSAPIKHVQISRALSIDHSSKSLGNDTIIQKNWLHPSCDSECHMETCCQLGTCSCVDQSHVVPEMSQSQPELDLPLLPADLNAGEADAGTEREDSDLWSASMPELKVSSARDDNVNSDTMVTRSLVHKRSHRYHHHHSCPHYHAASRRAVGVKPTPALGRVLNIHHPPASMITFHHQPLSTLHWNRRTGSRPCLITRPRSASALRGKTGGKPSPAVDQVDANKQRHPTRQSSCLGKLNRKKACSCPELNIKNLSMLSIEPPRSSFKVDALWLYVGAMAACGVATALVPALAASYPLLLAYCATFGFCIAANYALTSILLCKGLGMSKFTAAYGIICLGQGISNLLGPPLAGFLYDLTGNYNLSFYMAGIWIAISGLLLLFMPLAERWDVSRGWAIPSLEAATDCGNTSVQPRETEM
ncbi:PREDICTED: uncharacterized protein LOC106814203 [Priapulus caudatus]|uniref:Uncharacterized protein LOC106814203 n=1 Tax=Priapulus caudatus TaxID=37621 RepID=A0ABM1EP65_PRICU|nr:PREDICTED: uncharacterized protein LOC106814203 [Priapulus caudatus]